MKKKLLIFLTGSLIFCLFSQSVILANPPTSSGNYNLEYHCELINFTEQPINKITVKGLSLLQDNSNYYSLINQNIDGEIESKENTIFFTKKIEDIKPKSSTKIIHKYDVLLNPINTQIDINKVQPIKDRRPFFIYLNPEPYIESDNVLIKKVAQQLVGDEQNPYIKAKVLYEFVATKMKYNTNSPIQNTGSVNAIKDIKKAGVNQQQGGVCYDYATLYTALLRSQGIPARVISGFKITSYDLNDLEKYKRIDIIYNLHSWVEFYLEPYGWVFADPTIDSFSNDNIFSNFIQTDNLYIKKGYNLPSDILECTIESENKSDIKVRQSVILKKNITKIPIEETNKKKKNQSDKTNNWNSQDSKNTNNSNPIRKSQDDKKFIKINPINIDYIIDYRKKNVQKITEYQKAKHEYKTAEHQEQAKEVGKTEEKIRDSNKKITSSSHIENKENRLNIFQRIAKIFTNLFNKLFKE